MKVEWLYLPHDHSPEFARDRKNATCFFCVKTPSISTNLNSKLAHFFDSLLNRRAGATSFSPHGKQCCRAPHKPQFRLCEPVNTTRSLCFGVIQFQHCSSPARSLTARPCRHAENASRSA
ncbi:hypothetical protein [Paraburkholderia tropica]|uniref:hypothetical protein n=1 Tax=Paraburkholderia tropica TaxID=92647 RepID=UPI002AAFF503|nr:hypothetical protein [Paraburkholderia tropica]